ncbi:MAG: sigma-70 family RNA polymerase sigma factor [Rhodopirellula sp.]|nr:sigma-70 family RNA polymerase sigma factor [Rhodopirellula sp.]
MKPDRSVRSPDSHAVFPTTVWTLIREAQAASEQHRRELLCQLAARYWNPLYAYFRAKGQTRQDSQDLVQGLLWHLVSGDRLMQIPPRAKFRSWLMTCARNFLSDETRRAKAGRRHPPGGVRSLDQLVGVDARGFEPPSGDDPEQAYRDGWRRTVLGQALQSARDTCCQKGRGKDYDIFLAYYAPDDDGQPTWDRIAQQFGVENAKSAARLADWVKAQLARAIRAQVRQYVDSEADVDDEIRQLLG